MFSDVKNWFPIVVLAVGGLVGYGELKSRVTYLAEDAKRDAVYVQQFASLIPIIEKLDRNVDRMAMIEADLTVKLAEFAIRVTAMETEVTRLRTALETAAARSQNGATSHERPRRP